MNHPTIIYWKWDDTILEPLVMETKLQDIIQNTTFSMLYLSFHHMTISFTDARLQALVTRCEAILRQNGRGMMLDIDGRAELEGYLKKQPKGRAMTATFVEHPLDENGTCRFRMKKLVRRHTGRKEEKEGPVRVAGCWVFQPQGATKYEPETLAPATCTWKDGEDETEFEIVSQKEHAGKTALTVLIYPFTIPDIFAKEFYEYYEELFQKAASFPLQGVSNDEWGFDLSLKLDDQHNFWVNDFPYTDAFAQRYEEKTGIALDDAMLWFARRPVGQEGKSVAAIAAYTETLREGMKLGNDWFYETGKRFWGPDTFIGVHSTLWGDYTDSSLDILHNGLDWWEVRRDYTQTDEFIAMPVRLALAHRWGSPVWYNMWYSGGSQQFDTYLRESWRNARYGGRTHYLGYECPNENNVYDIKMPTELKQLGQMEAQIGKLDAFVSGQPDSRVLIVFGMEAISDWLDNFGGPKIVRSIGKMRNVLQYATGLFSHCLCDLVPSSEAVNGSLYVENGKARYGTQTYDAVILVEPQYLHPKALEFFQRYSQQGGRLMIVGECTMLSDGTESQQLQQVPATRLQTLSVIETVETLLQWEVPFHRTSQGCRFQDGTWVFTAKGVQATENGLRISQVLDGKTVEFLGEDFFAIRPASDSFAFGSCRKLTVDGKNLLPQWEKA